jgi:GT2 family glycosyltransferase
MITFIIPTMWKSDRIHETIQFFKTSTRRDIELIIIDNTNSEFSDPDPRITVIKFKENIFVNPAWNIGVSLATNPYICLVNDDVVLNCNCLLNNLDSIIATDPDFGIIGLYKRNFLLNDVNQDQDQVEMIEIQSRPFGFGCMMLMKKVNYLEIPSDLKIFYGDDLLWAYNKTVMKRKGYWLKGLKTPGQISATSSGFNTIGKQETPIYEAHLSKLLTRN